ncbi:MAG: metal ABC transporter substrate-binding protein [Anaerolineaceae bacterium]
MPRLPGSESEVKLIRFRHWIFPLLMTSLLISSCAGSPAQIAYPQALRVTATTSIVADIVRQVGGDYVQISTLVPIGTDEHQYQPTPQDVVNVSKAVIVFENGLGLEQFMDKLIQNAGGNAKVVSVSDGITPRQFSGDIKLPDEPTASSGGDPHVWVDPANVKTWVKNIEKTLGEADPGHAGEYAKNAQSTIDSLTALDEWIQAQVAPLPQSSRKIVTDHLIFGYFCDRYGFDQVGAIIPSYSSAAESSAQDLAAIEDAIRNLHINAIFLGKNVSSTLTQRVAEDTGVKIIQIYTGSLTTSDGPAPTYQDYMRYNVTAIVNGLSGGK